MTQSPKKWKCLLALMISPALVFLDQTILPVALPIIQQEFQATNTQLQWCVNAYLLAIAIFVLLGGKLGDRIGHRRALTWGVFGFGFFSALCGLSTSITTLIIARALQGVSAALIFPSQGSLIAQVYPEGQRGKAIGLLVSVGSLFLILGPFLGGYLTEAYSWRWIFWINLPTTVVGLWLVLQFLPVSEGGHGKIDLLGFFLFAVGVASLGIVLMQVGDWGWREIPSLCLMGLSVLTLVWLLFREQGLAHPFLDLGLFKRPVYAAINLTVATAQFILMISVFQTIYFENILGYSPLHAGLIFSISGCPTLFMAPIAGWLSDKYSPRVPLAFGYLALICAFFLFAFNNAPSLTVLLIALTLFGVGIPFIMTPSYSSAVASVPSQKTGVAMGMIATIRMLGGMIGLALIHMGTTLIQNHERAITGDRAAYMTSFSFIHLMLAFFLILSFALTFMLHSRKSAHQLPQGPSEGWD